MARTRRRAAVVKAERRPAQAVARDVADGVYVLAIHLYGSSPPLPVQLQAPIQYAAELLANVAIERHGLPEDRLDDATLFFLAGLEAMAVEGFAAFDRERFEAWVAAERERIRSRVPGERSVSQPKGEM